MASYYYLISSLPELRADAEMPLTYEEFLDLCSSAVNDKTMAQLKNLTLNSTQGPLMKQWSAFYGNLNKEINAQRRMNLGKVNQEVYDKDYEITQTAGSAMTAKNPLEAEKILLNFEFKNLDSMVGLHVFDDEFLFGYALKLKLLERQSCFAEKKGKAEFKRLFDHVQKQLYNY